jgi:hypothetical protein
MSVDKTADEIAELLEIDPEKVMIEPGLHPRISLSAGAAQRLLVLAKKAKDMREAIDRISMKHDGWFFNARINVPRELGENVTEARTFAMEVLKDLGLDVEIPWDETL